MNHHNAPEKPEMSLFHLFFSSTLAKNENLVGEEVSVPKGFVFNQLYEVPEYCYIVKSGRVVCSDNMPSGKQRIYTLFEKDSMFLEESVLLGWPSNVQFKAEMPTTLMRFTKCDLKRALKDYDTAIDYCYHLSSKFLTSMETVRMYQQKNAELRVCMLLQQFMIHYGKNVEGHILIDAHITQQMIADTLGINRVTITRICKRLKDEFLDQVNGKYCIRSAEAFQKYIDSLNNDL